MRRQLLVLPMIVTLLFGLIGTASAREVVPASGGFTAAIDFGTMTLTPVGANCELQVAGVVEFDGTIRGTGDALTTALVLAPCEDAAGFPPGTFRDVFSSKIQFSGEVDGSPLNADINYHGTVEEGGQIRGIMNFSNGLNGALRIDGQVATGGAYTGRVVLP
jgi:hypothetical protein